MIKKINLKPFFLTCFILTVGCATSVSSRHSASSNEPILGKVSVFPEPGLTNPKLRFHTGGVRENRPEISNDLPNIPGSVPSPWYFTQWRRSNFISPKIMAKDPERDSLLGSALYYFPSVDSRTYLKIYKGQLAPYVYELFSAGGRLDFNGGTNVFLSAESLGENNTFEKLIEYEVDLKFNKAKIKYDTLFASRGAVMSQMFTGFILRYQDPAHPTYLPTSLFMQIYHNNTGGMKEYRGCYRNTDGMNIVYGNVLKEDPRLDYVSSNRPPQKMKFVLNQYLCDLISRGFDCKDGDKNYKFNFPDAAKNFANWKVGSMYIGLETQDTDFRPGSSSNQPQGQVESAVQISNLKVTRNNAIPFDYAKDCH